MKKMLILAFAIFMCFALVGLTVNVETANAKFDHTWTLSASEGLGIDPVYEKECGLWDNAPGATGSTSGNGAVLWIECDNGGGGGTSLLENEWCRFRCTQIDINPAAGWSRLYIKYCRQAGIRFRLRIRYSGTGWVWVLSDSTLPSSQWYIKLITLSKTSGRVTGVEIEVDDTPNSIGSTIDVYMVLIDYIQIKYDISATIGWQENF